MNTPRDLAEALAKGCLRCECEHESHTGPHDCQRAEFEHRTDYGKFLVCAKCHEAGHMPLREAATKGGAR